MRKALLALAATALMHPALVAADELTCFGKEPTMVVTIEDSPLASGGDSVFGTSGDDVIILLERGVVDAGDGDDLVCGSPEKDGIDGGDGNDRIRGGGERDGMQGGEGSDLVRGDGGKDRLRGGPGNDVVKGGEMRDELRGEEGNDVLYSGLGTRWGGAGTFFDDPGNDKFIARLPATLNFRALSSGVEIDLKAGTISSEEIGTDRITGPIYKIVATAHDDRIFGSSFDENVSPGEGRDVVNLRGGHDSVATDYEPSGTVPELFPEETPVHDDVLRGGAGRDSVGVATAFQDRPIVNLRTGEVRNGHGIDRIDGFENAWVAYEAGVLVGDGYANELWASGGGVVRGGGGDDVLGGGFVDEPVRILGGTGDDKLTGSYAADDLDGGGGFDRLNGKDQDDICRNGEILLNCEGS